MSRKVQLRLVSSKKMTDAGEHNIIRFPKRAREFFGFSNSMVVIGKGEYETALHVKQALKGDIRNLARMIQAGKVSEEEAASVGFVTRNVRDRINRKEGTRNNIWVTEGIGKITVGADPEFGLVAPNGILKRGNQVVPHAGLFGSDGPSVEVRPQPSRDHRAVVGNIEHILAHPPDAATKYRWQGGATYQDQNRVYWFGGHIHLGRPSQIDQDYAWNCYASIATVLDGLLALPMVRFDTPEPWQRRNGCQYNYGKAGDIRADYPEQDRFEYRVLSGLWLTHPTLARIALGAAKCIAETAYNRVADQKFDYEWVEAPASRKGLIKSFGVKGWQQIRAVINNARPDQVTPEMLRDWRNRIRDLDLYDEYAPELNALIALAEAPPGAVEKDLLLDVRRNWNDEQPLLPKGSKKLRDALDALEAE